MAFIPQTLLPKSVSRISISLASSDAILARSHGEVTKPETVNYRTFRPEKDGLFCEKIFGPVRDWECHCGKYKRIRYRGIVCDRCGVEVTQKSVRRERQGHIALAVPVVHIWYLRSLPSKISTLLGMPTKDVERIAYYESYVVVNPGTTGLHVQDLLSEEQYLEILESLPETNNELDDDDPKKFVALIGGEAIRQLLHRIDPEQLHEQLREVARTETSQQKRQEAVKRLRVIEAFREHADDRVQNKPEWMVLDIVPIIPPELRPLVPLEGGRFATSDLNDLYRRVIIRNNRLKRLIDIKAPEVILRNEKRMLQEAVDALFDNSRRVSAVRTGSQRALKSLSDMLKGKQGRFRQNLLGKRVDYSGRSVIVVGPELRMHECGLPKDMAVELFKPFIIRKLIERGIVRTVKSAKKSIERKEPEIWDILETVVDNHLVLLNRAPTLHRLGIQAFQPRLVEGKALQIHPLVCAAFNADFDGDQMAVHVPLSYDAQLEALLLMLSTNNVVSPQNGTPVAVPSQDMVLGLYYLTKQKDNERGEGKLFASAEEVLIAYNTGCIGLHAKIKVRINHKLTETTVGRVVYNQIVPPEMGYMNELLTKKRLGQIIAMVFRRCGNVVTVKFLDNLKNLGFTYATKGGLSVNIEDIIVPGEKTDIVDRAQKEVDKIEENYRNGFMTNGERYNKIIDTWTKATSRVADKLFTSLQSSKVGFNSLYMMVDSGARGSKEQVRQLSGMRGLMAKPQKSLTGQTGELIENPVISNFREGLTILEYFISTHGARKGLADTALKTADAGYLTRRLVDVAQDVVITEIDCGTIRGVKMTALKEGEDIKEPLYERILGRVTLQPVVDPISGEKIAPAAVMIDEDIAQKISETSIEEVDIRSVLTCESRRGICVNCYGRNLTTGKLVDIGEAVGVIAAQSIGEPGTQLTLRTFHTGGTATLIASQSQVTAKFEGKIEFESVKKIMRGDGKEIVIGRSGVVHVLDRDNRVVSKYDIPYGSVLMVREGSHVAKGELIYERDPYNAVIITEFEGAVRYKDLIQDVTYREEPDEQTGHITKAVIDSRDRTKTPTIEIVRPDGKVSPYVVPTHAHLIVDDGVDIGAGEILVKIPRETGKQRDITGGLPRVTELFEARSHGDYAVIAEIDGVVSFDKPKRGARVLVITSHDGKIRREYTIPIGKHVLVQVSDTVRSGERVTDGIVNPRDILHIQGVGKVQEYLVNEIQDVYRMQGVKLNDKHIETIVRQMLQKVRIIDPGDTSLLVDDQVDRAKFLEENENIDAKVVITERHDSKFKIGQLVNKRKFKETNAELRKKDKTPAVSRPAEPATSEPVLLGITQASLSTESFISAASFQETTKVLTDAAVEGKVDYLYGLKENVIVGHLIPAGTGLKKYLDILVTSKNESIFNDYPMLNGTKKEAAEETEVVLEEEE